MRTILSSLSRAAMPRASASGYTVDNVDQRAVVLHAMSSRAIVECRCFWVRLCVSLETHRGRGRIGQPMNGVILRRACHPQLARYAVFNSRMTAWTLPDDDVMGCTNDLIGDIIKSAEF